MSNTPRERLMRTALASLNDKYEALSSYAKLVKREYDLEGERPSEIIIALAKAIKAEKEANDSVRIT